MSDGPNTTNTPAPFSGSPVAGTVKQPPKPGGVRGLLATIISTIFKPIVWLIRPLVFRVGKESGNPKVYFTSFSNLLYLWPIMLLGWIGPYIEGFWIFTPGLLGWVWITVMFIVILCIGSDTDRNKTAAIAAIVLILWLSGLLLEAKKGIPVLSNIFDFFANYNVKFDPGTAGVFSIATLITLLFVVGAAWFDGRYEITTREITHKRIFRTSDSLPRAAKRIKRDWRDMIEVFLGLGAGDVIVLDTNSNIVMRIPNVPFLWFFRHDVDHILEVLATTEVADIAAAIEEEDAA